MNTLERLEQAYLVLLGVPHSDFTRVLLQPTLCQLRDLIANARDEDPETIQNSFTDLAYVSDPARTAARVAILAGNPQPFD